jgi:hypothetical protein
VRRCSVASLRVRSDVVPMRAERWEEHGVRNSALRRAMAAATMAGSFSAAVDANRSCASAPDSCRPPTGPYSAHAVAAYAGGRRGERPVRCGMWAYSFQNAAVQSWSTGV